MSSFRHQAGAIGLLAGGLALAFLIFRFAVYEPPRPSPARVAAAPSQKAVVLSVEGEVERSAVEGRWSALVAGETVGTGDRVRTGAHGKTDLRIDGQSRVTIGASSEVRVRELTSNVHRFLLTRGRMNPDYALDGKRVLRVEGSAGTTVAETRGARFSVLSTGTTIAVATTSGEVALRSQGAAVSVESGQESVALSGQQPSSPRAIPAAVILKVGNAITAASSVLCAEVDGEVEPGSLVLIDGVETKVAEGGHFHERVLRAAGKDKVGIETIDPAGRRRTRTVSCVPPSARIRDMAIRWKEAP